MVKKFSTKNPKFSLLLPTHNRADVISCAIESVLYQTDKNFELLIVGDGCTDSTAKVVKKYLKDKRVKWFDLPKAPGFGYANRNIVLKKAKGKYIGFIAHDDLLFPDHLELLGGHLDRDENIDIVYSRPLWVNENGLIIPSSYNLNNSEIMNYFINVKNGIPAACFMHRKTCFAKVGYWDETLLKSGDWDLWRKIIISGKMNNFLFESQPTCFHFKAIWRETNQFLPRGLVDLTSFITLKPEIISDNLTLSISKGKKEQSIFWRKLKNDRDWIYKIRKDSFALLDRLLQFEFPEFIKKLKDMESQISILKIELKEKRRINRKVQLELDSALKYIKKFQKTRLFKFREWIIKSISPKAL